MHILRCMCSILFVKLKFDTKFWTHTQKNVHFTILHLGVSVTISLNCDVKSLGETGPRYPSSGQFLFCRLFPSKHDKGGRSILCWYMNYHGHATVLYIMLRHAALHLTEIHMKVNPSWPHDDVIKWKHFPRNWPFVREIHRSPVNFPHKGQWRGALMFSLNYAWINDWVNNREAGDLRRQHGHYDVIVMVYVVDYVPLKDRRTQTTETNKFCFEVYRTEIKYDQSLCN